MFIIIAWPNYTRSTRDAEDVYYIVVYIVVVVVAIWRPIPCVHHEILIGHCTMYVPY